MPHTVNILDEEHIPGSKHACHPGRSDLARARQTDHELASGFRLLGMAAPGGSSSEEDSGSWHRLGHAQNVWRGVVGFERDVDVIEAGHAVLIREQTRVAQHRLEWWQIPRSRRARSAVPRPPSCPRAVMSCAALGHAAMVTADRATLPWWWRLLRACCFVLAGIAVMVVFVCMASEGGNGETEKKNSHQERVCLSVAAPLMIGFGGAALWLDRSARRQRPR
jgi:hypothetical protein